MDYEKRNWVNNAPPARNATNLNAMDDGIYEANLAALQLKANTLDGVAWPSGGGDINFVAGTNTTLESDNVAKTITINSAGGTATGLTTTDTVALLKAATGVANGEYRYLGGYYAANDGGDSVVRRNTALSSFDEGVTFGHNTEAGGWERVGLEGRYDVRLFGAKGIGSGGASFDQAAFSAAVTAAGTDGTVEGSPGDYWVTGGFSLGIYARFVCAGSSAVSITHTGNNTFLSSTTEGGDWVRHRRFEGFRLAGNTGASAKGIVHGNSFKPQFKDVAVSGYTLGTGIETTSSITWTEGSSFEDVHVRSCLKCMSFTKSGTGTGSFRATRMSNVMCVVDTNDGTGIWFDDGVAPYGSELDANLHVTVATGTGMRVGAGTVLWKNLYALYFELTNTTAKGIRTLSGSEITGDGTIFPALSARHSSGAVIHDIHKATKLDIGQSPNRVYASNEGSDTYWHIATLPASTSSTYDKLVIDFFGGPGWTSASITADRVMMSRRGGFWAQYWRGGVDNAASRGDLRIVAHELGDGSVDVNVRAVAGTFSVGMVEARIVGLGGTGANIGPSAENLELKSPTTTTPTGTLVFDSGSSASYAPYLAGMDVGPITSNGVNLSGANQASQSLNFSSISNGAAADLTITVTGAAVGDAVVLGPPALASGLVASAFVSATNTVTVRLANLSGSSVDPAAQTYLVKVLKA